MYANVAFEVFGKVQGVFFRKCTIKQAKQLGLVGWVRNTERGTVEGQAQGQADEVAELKTWLRSTGSPKSVIQDASFKDSSVEKLEFDDFVQRS